jgi:hypothetical protein
VGDDDKLRAAMARCRADVEEFKKKKEYDPTKVGRFGDFIFIIGNLTHTSIRRRVVRKHYSWMTCAWAEAIDGITTSDDGWKEWFIKNVDLFAVPETRWVHFLTSDAHLHARLSRDHPRYRVIDGHCACICNEVARTALTKEEVEALIKREKWHYHFLVECPTDKVNSCVRWVQSYLGKDHEDPFCKPTKNGAYITVLDKMRGFHYVHRREASTGLPLHFYLKYDPKFRWAPDSWKTLWQRIQMKRPDVAQINHEYLRQAQSECKNCLKAAIGYCNQHITYDDDDYLDE